MAVGSQVMAQWQDGQWHPAVVVALQNGMIGVDWTDPNLGASSWVQPHQITPSAPGMMGNQMVKDASKGGFGGQQAFGAKDPYAGQQGFGGKETAKDPYAGMTVLIQQRPIGTPNLLTVRGLDALQRCAGSVLEHAVVKILGERHFKVSIAADRIRAVGRNLVEIRLRQHYLRFISGQQCVAINHCADVAGLTSDTLDHDMWNGYKAAAFILCDLPAHGSGVCADGAGQGLLGGSHIAAPEFPQLLGY
jgi:hypothetical protein